MVVALWRSQDWQAVRNLRLLYGTILQVRGGEGVPCQDGLASAQGPDL